jgi:Family of unknown function (DUF6352)
MPDFWRSSGYHLLDTAENGRLAVTNAFLRAYFMRPEIQPVAESCPAERRLHAALLDDPRRTVAAGEIAALADPDARDNYEVLLAFRDRLAASATIEDCYLKLFVEPPRTPVPPLFIDQLAHVIMRRILDGIDDPLRARAGELFFRAQKITIQDGAIMAADEDVVEMYARTGGLGAIGELLVESNTPVRSVELDVLTDGNRESYWGRDERHDTVLDLTFGRAGLDALARDLEAWVRHFLSVRVSIQPVARIADERWVWHVGLDAQANAIMNDLYNGVEVGDERLAQVLALFRLEFADPQVMRADIAGRPVYLGMAKDAGGHMRLKPQNLLMNLPLAPRA